MIKRYISIVALMLCSQLMFAGNYSGKLNFNNAKLIERGDSLHFCVEIEVENRPLHRREAIRIIPMLVAGENYVELPDVMIQGGNKNKSWDRSMKLMSKKELNRFDQPTKTIVANKEGRTLLSYNFSMPFSSWMESAKMLVHQELIDYQDRRGLITYKLDSEMQLEKREPYRVSPMVNYIEPEIEKKVRHHQGQAFLDFRVGRSNIEPGFRRNPMELSKIDEVFSDIKANKDVKIVGLYIEGYASPDGGFATNERLSKERALALKDYIMTTFNPPLKDEQIKVSWTPEDWLGLKGMVSMSNLSNKDVVIDIIDTVDDLEKRKSRLRLFGGGTTYNTMLREMFPQLRRVEYQVNFTVRDFTVEETKELISQRSNLISHYELYRAAETYPVESREFENLMLDIAPVLFPKDPIATINAAAAMIKRGEILSAKRYLERHSDMSAAWNNLGVVYLIENELDKARELFEKSIAAGVKEAEHNMNELMTKELELIKENK